MTVKNPFAAFQAAKPDPTGAAFAALPLDRLTKKEVQLGTIREIVKPENHIGLDLFPFYEVPSDDYMFDYVKGLTTGLAPATAETAEAELSQRDSGLANTGRGSTIDWRLKDQYDAADVQRFLDLQLMAEQGLIGPYGLPNTFLGEVNQFAAIQARDTAERRRKLDNRLEWLHMTSLSAGGVAYNDGNVKFAVDWKRPSDQHAQPPASGSYAGTTHDPIGDINKIKRLIYDRYGVEIKTALCSNKYLLSLINSDKFILRGGMGPASTSGLTQSDIPYLINGWGPQVAIETVQQQCGITFIEYDSGYRSKPDFAAGPITFNRFTPENRVIFLPDESQIREYDSSPIGFGKMMTSPHVMGNNQAGFYEWEKSDTDPWTMDQGTGIKAFPLFPHMELSYTMDVTLPA